MFFTEQDRQRIGRVEIKRLESHLRSKGWTLDEQHADQRRRTWDRLGFTVDVPAWAGFTDYGRRIGEVVTTLARVEDRYPNVILDDLLREAVRKEGPIIFSDPMVRALLDGIKTQTRRLLKPNKHGWLPTGGGWRYDGLWDEEDGGDGSHYMERLDDSGKPTGKYESVGRCPYGEIGDHLWVRETWCPLEDEIGQIYPLFRASWFPQAEIPGNGKWKSAMYMPRAVSRLMLDITEIRIERLQAISEADAMAEGMALFFRGNTRYEYEARDAFQHLWGKLHRGVISWNRNPWVWVIGFRSRRVD